jgi:hypothetical protein
MLMWGINETVRSAATARNRLLDDQLVRPLVEQRLRLSVLTKQLDRAAREALIGAVAGRVKGDPRFMPVLQRLLRPAGAEREAEPRRSGTPVDPRRLVAARSQGTPGRR